MKKERAVSQYNSVRHQSKRHCPEDLTCQQCCRCVEQLKKQNKILSEKNQGWVKDKDMYEREIMRLRRGIREWEKKKEELQDLPELKRRLKEELKLQLDKDRTVEEMILGQKMASAKEERDHLKRQNDDLLEQLNIQSLKTKKNEGLIRDLVEKMTRTEQQLQIAKKLVNKKDEQQQSKRLKERNVVLEGAVKDKTNVIKKLEEQLAASENNYLTLKAKISDYEFEMLKSQQEMKMAAHSVQSLKKQAEESKTSIQELSIQNTKLDRLVKQLDSTIGSYTMLEGELRNRILVTQDYALQKEIETKLLQSDYYDMIYRSA